MRTFLAFLKDEKAASVVEFGLLSGLLVAVLIGSLAVGARLTSS